MFTKLRKLNNFSPQLHPQPTYSKIVVGFSQLDIDWQQRGLGKVLRDTYGVKKALCLETLEGFMVPNLHELTQSYLVPRSGVCGRRPRYDGWVATLVPSRR